MTVMPFGKFRGLPLSTVRADRQYCGWLCSQPWFAEKFAALHRRLSAEPVTVTGTVVPWEAVASRFGCSDDSPTPEPRHSRRTRASHDTMAEAQEAPCAR
jgi:hypothetical protein